MFKVTFASPVALDGNPQIVFQSSAIETCIEVAMLVHRYSNVPHIILVVLIHPDNVEETRLTLVLKENPCRKDRK